MLSIWKRSLLVIEETLIPVMYLCVCVCVRYTSFRLNKYLYVSPNCQMMSIGFQVTLDTSFITSVEHFFCINCLYCNQGWNVNLFINSVCLYLKIIQTLVKDWRMKFRCFPLTNMRLITDVWENNDLFFEASNRSQQKKKK